MADETDAPAPPTPRCAACGGVPVQRHDGPSGPVHLCPACAAAEGLGCP